MVFKAQDIKHLDMMSSLESSVVKPTITKKAEKVLSEFSFDENILKLCDDLRSKGFVKQADSIEDKFLVYKSAQKTHLYRAHDEDGEDLINAAHPDGDNKSIGEELGDVETIISKHKKIVDVVKKEPIGKQACKDIINLVKLALDIDQSTIFFPIVNEIVSEVKRTIIDPLNNDKYKTISLGENTVESFLENIINEHDRIIRIIQEAKEDGDNKIFKEMSIKGLRTLSSKLINDCVTLLKAIRTKSEQDENSGFDSTYAVQQLAVFTSLSDRYNAYIYQYVEKNPEKAKAFKAHLSIGQIDTLSSDIIKKYYMLNSFIKTTLLTNSEIVKNKQIVDYLKYVSEYLSAGVEAFNLFKTEAVNFENTSATSLNESAASIDINVIKNIFDKIKDKNPQMKDFCADLNFQNLDSFASSADNVMKSVSDSIKKIFDSWKDLSGVKEQAIARMPK